MSIRLLSSGESMGRFLDHHRACLRGLRSQKADIEGNWRGEDGYGRGGA